MHIEGNVKAEFDVNKYQISSTAPVTPMHIEGNVV